MPNWCENEVNIYGTKEQLQTLVDEVFTEVPAFGDETKDETKLVLDYNKIVPEPEDIGEGWYDWRTINWGVKWDLVSGSPENSDVDMDLDSKYASIHMMLLTPWSPPEPIVDALRERYPEIEIDWFYKESGMQLAGWV